MVVGWNAAALVTSRHVSLRLFRDDAYLLDNFFSLMDPSSAVYATDEVSRMLLSPIYWLIPF